MVLGRRTLMLNELTAREREVLALIGAGKSTKELAGVLGIAFKTACCHRARILNKLAPHDTAEMLRIASERGLIRWPDGQSPNAQRGELPVTRVPSLLEERRKEREMLSGALAEYRMLRRELRENRNQMRLALNSVLDQTRNLVSDGTRKDRQLARHAPHGSPGLHQRGARDVQPAESTGSITTV
jgi:DNA-binding CsgD family transcriptional regulator